MATADARERTAHGMVPGSHERLVGGPECHCGAAWSRWADRCVTATASAVLRCDSCGQTAPDVVGPILLGINRWATFAIDGVHDGREWEATVLLCGTTGFSESGCARRMEAFIAGRGPRIRIATTDGGRVTEAAFAAQHAAAAPTEGEKTHG